jgi:hypothetical protein
MRTGKRREKDRPESYPWMTYAAHEPVGMPSPFGCPNGDVNVGGTQLGANTQPNGDGIPTGSWAAYVIHG